MKHFPAFIERRDLLRGAAFSLALPVLPSFARIAKSEDKPSRVASAQPKRLVCVGTQLGFYRPEFFGSNPIAKLLSPLVDAGLAGDFSTISGLMLWSV